LSASLLKIDDPEVTLVNIARGGGGWISFGS